jgi:hypothetical protein
MIRLRIISAVLGGFFHSFLESVLNKLHNKLPSIIYFLGFVTTASGSYVFWKPLESFVLSMAEHQNTDVITVVGDKYECTSSYVEELAAGLARKLPTRRVPGNELINRNFTRTLIEVS